MYYRTREDTVLDMHVYHRSLLLQQDIFLLSWFGRKVTHPDPHTLSSMSFLQTMTFYEGGEASNGETQATLDISSSSVTSPSEKVESPFATPPDTAPAAATDTPASPMEQ